MRARAPCHRRRGQARTGVAGIRLAGPRDAGRRRVRPITLGLRPPCRTCRARSWSHAPRHRRPRRVGCASRAGGVTDPTSIEVVARPDPDLETAFVGGEAVLLNVETGAVYSLNPSASAVWLLLDGVASVQAIADELREFVPLPDDVLRA